MGCLGSGLPGGGREGIWGGGRGRKGGSALRICEKKRSGRGLKCVFAGPRCGSPTSPTSALNPLAAVKAQEEPRAWERAEGGAGQDAKPTLSLQGPLGNGGALESRSDRSLILAAKKSREFRHFLAMRMRGRTGWVSGAVGEGNGTPLQYSHLENPMDGGAWWAAVHGVTESLTRLSDFTFTFHFHALEEEMATHSSVLAWRTPGTGEPGGLPSLGSHRVGHD